ncbi:MAG: AMP-binding protein [Myxococcota bacterium]|nr:AMP-binding protein [Myxococcota bacterium]
MSRLDLAAHGLIAAPRRSRIPGDAAGSVADVLDRAVREAPEFTALVGRHARYSYAELDRQSNRAAHALLAAGLREGDRIAMSLENQTEIVVAFLGAMRIGAIWAGINRNLAGPEKQFILHDAGVRLFLGDAAACQQLSSRRSELPSLARVIEVRPGEASCGFRELLASAADETRPALDVDPSAPAAIAYTSGTTGVPKGAVHSQHNLLLPGAIAAYKGRATSATTVGVCLPLTVLNLMVLGPVLSAQVGCKCVLMDRLDAVGIAAWIRDERIVSFASVPTTFHDLLTHPDVAPGDLESLTQPGVGGANCPEEFKQLYRKRFGIEVQEGYGLTEAPTSVSHTDPQRPRIPGSVGKPHPHQVLRIEDESGTLLPPREVGEVCVGPTTEGPWAGVYTPMLGYWNRAEASAEALRGGWLHTGDLGYLDEEGNLYISDRKADMILRGGANVYSAEVERVLHEDPRVAECAVIGTPDERLGERVAAVIQLEAGARGEQSVLEAELMAHCRDRLARYKCPEQICFVDAFPRNAMNKIVKRELAALLGLA